MNGIEIARKLNVSTSALRHYEAWGLVPEVERAANGYRIYGKKHEAYFQCIRALLPGFGMGLVRQVMPLVVKGEKLEALWIVNKAQVDLRAERDTALRAMELMERLGEAELPPHLDKNAFTIGEAAKLANVSASAIRYWEKEGLIKPERHGESGFRLYTQSDIRSLLIIRTVQRAAYSLDIVREVLSGLRRHHVAQAKEMARQSLQYIDQALIEQVKGIASLQNLFDF